jgi:hypothetical protein
LDLDFLTKRKDNVEVPQGIDTPMWFYGDNYKLVRCKNLGYAYEMRFLLSVFYLLRVFRYSDCNMQIRCVSSESLTRSPPTDRLAHKAIVP